MLVPTVSRIIQQFKGYVTKQTGESIWQKSYYDHIIRDDEDYYIKARYIEENPLRWCPQTGCCEFFIIKDKQRKY